MAWTDEQIQAIQIAERVSSSFSLIGSFFVIITFCSSPAFRKPINRLIFYATFGNIMSAIAMLIARKGVIAGEHSALCQVQAFFIQQWMVADPLWSFCMALNVYFTFYKRYTASQLRNVEWKYLVVCYGLPLIPNLIMFFIHTKSRGRIYGPATLWCSITSNWAYLRIACFYGPVWLISLSTLVIFIRVGRDVLRADRNFRHFVSPNSAHHNRAASLNRASSMPIHKVTTVEIQREVAPMKDDASNPASIPSMDQASTAPAVQYGGTSTTNIISPHPPRYGVEPHTGPVARSYLRCSLLFFLAMVVTWFPSSINRIYALIDPTAANYPLNFLAATLLPLQGLWNCLIYTTTSFSIFIDLFTQSVASIKRRRRSIPRSGVVPFLGRGPEREGFDSSGGVSFGKPGAGYVRT